VGAHLQEKTATLDRSIEKTEQRLGSPATNKKRLNAVPGSIAAQRTSPQCPLCARTVPGRSNWSLRHHIGHSATIGFDEFLLLGLGHFVELERPDDFRAYLVAD
jgi:hypothetical protein